MVLLKAEFKLSPDTERAAFKKMHINTSRKRWHDAVHQAAECATNRILGAKEYLIDN